MRQRPSRLRFVLLYGFPWRLVRKAANRLEEAACRITAISSALAGAQLRASPVRNPIWRRPETPQLNAPAQSRLPARKGVPGEPAKTTPGEAGYDASAIEVLEGLEPVRRRPGMYIGGTDEKALHHLFAEVIDNAMDEAVAGHATFIEVELEEDG